MRKRNVAILFRLNKKEAEALDKKVKRSGLNREAYLRQLISGVVPRDAPPSDYYSMMRELHKIGNNLNQIAQKAHVLNVVDVQRYDKEVRKFNEAVRKITEAVILPEKNESWQDYTLIYLSAKADAYIAVSIQQQQLSSSENIQMPFARNWN